MDDGVEEEEEEEGLRKRRGLYWARSGPQMGSAWMRAPGIMRTESFFNQ